MGHYWRGICSSSDVCCSIGASASVRGALGDIISYISHLLSGWGELCRTAHALAKQQVHSGIWGTLGLGSHMIDMICWWLNQRITGVCTQTCIFVEQRQWPGSDTLVQVDVDRMVQNRVFDGLMLWFKTIYSTIVELTQLCFAYSH